MNLLFEILDEQIKVYRLLLEVVRREKEILVSARLDELNENNRSKESLLMKAKDLEMRRLHEATKVAQSLGFPQDKEPRLLEMAHLVDPATAERLRSIHSVLDLLLKRVQSYNSQNENLVQSALENITGAMKALRDTLKEGPTYQRRGEKDSQMGASGQLVSREA